MLKQFSCHTILQKSYRVSCLGPGGKEGGNKKRRDKNNYSVKDGLCNEGSIFFFFFLVWLFFATVKNRHYYDLPQMAGYWSLKTVQSINLLGIPGRRGNGWWVAKKKEKKKAEASDDSQEDNHSLIVINVRRRFQGDKTFKSGSKRKVKLRHAKKTTHSWCIFLLSCREHPHV